VDPAPTVRSGAWGYFGELLAEKRENPEGSYLLKFLEFYFKNKKGPKADVRIKPILF